MVEPYGYIDYSKYSYRPNSTSQTEGISDESGLSHNEKTIPPLSWSDLDKATAINESKHRFEVPA